MALSKFMLLLILGTQILPTMAQTASQSVVDAAVSGEDGVNLVVEQSALELSLSLLRYQQEIERIESENGPYDIGLVETLSGLGRHHQQLDQHANAISVFERALHIERISTGLVSESQLPILRELMSSNTSLKDWENVNKYHHLSWHIQSRLYSPGDKRFADAVVKFGDWKLTVYRENLLDYSNNDRLEEMEDLNEIYALALQKIERKDALLAISTLSVLYGKAITEFEISNYFIQLPYQYYEGLVREYISERVCRNVVNSSGKRVTSCRNVQRLNPGYRDSQRQQKQFAVRRSMGGMEDSLQKAQSVLATNAETVVGDGENQRKVNELEELYGQLVQRSRGRRFR